MFNLALRLTRYAEPRAPSKEPGYGCSPFDLVGAIREVAPSAFPASAIRDPYLRAIAENQPVSLQSKRLPGRPRKDGLPPGSALARYADGKLKAQPRTPGEQWLARIFGR